MPMSSPSKVRFPALRSFLTYALTLAPCDVDHGHPALTMDM